MKFCTSCGHEMFDDAVVCTNCGRAVAGFSHNDVCPTLEPQQAPITAKESVIVSVLGFISSLTSAFSAFFLFLSVIGFYVDVSTNTYYYAIKIYSNTYIYYNHSWAVIALIVSGCSIGFSLASLITSLVKHQKCRVILSSILKMVIGILLLLASIVTLAS